MKIIFYIFFVGLTPCKNKTSPGGDVLFVWLQEQRVYDCDQDG